MTSGAKSLMAIALLTGGVLAATAHEATPSGRTMMGGDHGGMCSDRSMMGEGSDGMTAGMMGMMQQMTRMMETCNEMMQSRASEKHAPEESGSPAE